MTGWLLPYSCKKMIMFCQIRRLAETLPSSSLHMVIRNRKKSHSLPASPAATWGTFKSVTTISNKYDTLNLISIFSSSHTQDLGSDHLLAVLLRISYLISRFLFPICKMRWIVTLEGCHEESKKATYEVLCNPWHLTGLW